MNFAADFSIDFSGSGDLKSAALISLFTWSRGPQNQFGWWFRVVGSTLYLHQRDTINQVTLKQIRDTVLESLYWLVASGVADDIDVQLDRTAYDTIQASITLLKEGSTLLSLEQKIVWGIDT